jgi:exopolysaccharide production protein ExoQ
MIHDIAETSSKWTVQSFLRQPVDMTIGYALIFSILFLSEANFRQTLAMDSGADWQALMKLGISAACGLYGLWFTDFARLKDLGLVATGIVMFCIWTYVCALKSVNVVYSLTCCTTLFCTLVFADAVSQKLGKQKTILVCLFSLFAFLIGCWIMSVIAPGLNSFDPLVDAIADSRRFAGLLHPNGTAALGATTIGLAFVAANAGYLPWKQVLPLIIFAFLTVFLTGSRTWMFAALLVSCYGTMKHLSTMNRFVIVCIGTLLVSILSVYLLNIWNATKADQALAGISRSGKSEEIYSMTGRADLWAFCIKKIEVSPIFGYGYGCQRFIIADEHFWPTRHAHNVLLNATLGTGLIGGALLAIVFLVQTFRMFVDRNDFPDTVLLLLLAGGFTENPIFNQLPGALTFLFFASLSWRDTTRIGP